MNVVTLLPSATEIAYALGIGPVGVSHECDVPPAAAAKPSINRSRIDAGASSAEIDAQVLDAERAGGVYEIDIAALDRVDPDLIVTQGICDVCAVDSVLVEDAVDRIDADPEILTTDPHSVGDVLDDIERIGRATGRAERAADVVADLEARIDAVRERTAEIPDAERPEVAILDWLDPVMVAGHWIPELVEWAGGEYGLAEHGARSRPREWAEIREHDPDVLVAAPCGFDLDQTRENLDDLTDRAGWSDLRAVETGRAFALDGHEYANRPGPRLVETLEYLAGLFHPDRFAAPPDDAAAPLPELAEIR
ncbi:iron complex transport system substrate-binding protein [Natronoarchaeum philippinense]|uniref:Iron complex transport system substrate-binding protein n=1 Tax=Natronoarchaeum philippinense TaxID=558529 RepID=A0A285P3G0_NATPI|nr:cobalamin-binding protein [Natronoarchaeum philippinense]SNZ15978.1 iron complex transport system substrate-binding protein [Natronoarchaeum philippinense]